MLETGMTFSAPASVNCVETSIIRPLSRENPFRIEFSAVPNCVVRASTALWTRITACVSATKSGSTWILGFVGPPRSEVVNKDTAPLGIPAPSMIYSSSSQYGRRVKPT